jgi:hypothetical protein
MGRISAAAAAFITGITLLFFAPEALASPTSQDSAVRTAQQYLELQGFSRQGLIKQLEYDSYSYEDAAAAVDSIDIDYNAQAAKSAQQYLGLQGFSHGGMVKQLTYDGYTADQAEYGASSAGL